MRAILLVLALASGCTCQAHIESKPNVTQDAAVHRCSDEEVKIINEKLDDKKLSDRDQVLQMEACMQAAGYRR